MVVKVRENQRVSNKAVYLVLGVTMEGQKELLGMWMSEHEGAKFWLTVFTELHNRGMKDCFIACVDGLTGLPEAIETVFPWGQAKRAKAQIDGIEKLFKAKLGNRAAIRRIDGASTDDIEQELERFAEKWDGKYAPIAAMWRRNWERVAVFFAYPEEIRRVIYTTNAIESVNMTLRKVTRNHRIFPSDEAVYKVLYLAIRNIAKRWTMPLRDWKPALNRFAIEFAGRFPH